MLDRVLVPLDGSPLAERVLPYAASIAKALQCPVTLLHIVDQSNLTEGIRSIPPSLQEKMWDDATAASRAYLEERVQAFRTQGVEALTSILQGEPAAVIGEISEKESATTLIAMSTHARTGLERVVMGSVADRVLQSTRSPLLLVRPREGVIESGEIKRFIVTMDGSQAAESILPIVTDLAKALGARVTLLWVLPSTTGLYGTPSPPADILQAAEGTADSYLTDVTERLRQAGLEADYQILRSDNAAGAIVNYAKDAINDVVAMSTHGRSGLGRWVLGSVTSQVVRSSSSPVLVVRSREDAQ